MGKALRFLSVGLSVCLVVSGVCLGLLGLSWVPCASSTARAHVVAYFTGQHVASSCHA